MSHKKLIYQRITNFRGIKKLEISFDAQNTDIFGDNSTGKSSIVDAHTWLLWGKDVFDRKDYDIKYRDPNGNNIDKQDVEVEEVWNLGDGKQVKIKRIYREVWAKIRGRAEERMTGHEHLVFWNSESPITQAEFKALVEEHICDERTFKILTNPLYFNSIDWKERRKILIEMSGEVDNNDIWNSVKTKDNQAIILSIIEESATGKSYDQIKKDIATLRLKATEELKLVKPRIEEKLREIPNVIPDFPAIKTEIEEKKAEITKLDELIAQEQEWFKERDTRLAKLRQEKRNKEVEQEAIVRDLRQIEQEKDNKEDADIAPLKVNIEGKERELRSVKLAIENINMQISLHKETLVSLRNSWAEQNKKEVDYSKINKSCPACERPFDEDEVAGKMEKVATKFNEDKRKQMTAIEQEAASVKENLEQYKVDLQVKDKQVELLDSEIDKMKKEYEQLDSNRWRRRKVDERVKDILVDHSAYISLTKEIDDINLVINSDGKAEEEERNSRIRNITNEKNVIISTLSDSGRKLAEEDQIDKAKKRITELELQAKSIASTIAEYEQKEFVFSEFTKEKMSAVEQKVNSMFSICQFRMFENQINGGEKELCDVMKNGVEYGTVNTGGKIQMGCDVINTYSDFKGIYLPAMLDNRESTTSIPLMNTQIVNFFVSKDDKVLRINN